MPSLRRVHLRRLALLALTAVVLAGCAPARASGPRAGTSATPAVAKSVRVRHGGTIQTVPLDTYAAVVALTEFAPGAESQETALSLYTAQIIVARTYGASRIGRHGAEGFDLCDATHCQRYEASRLRTGRWAALAQTIARETAAEVLIHGGALVEAVFHADCGGHTANAADVWRTARPYLVEKRDAVDGHRQWESMLPREDVEAALRKDRRTRVAGSLDKIEVARRDASGRAARVRLVPRRGAAVEVEGDVFRAVISAALGFRALPSTRFSLDSSRAGWRATGSGFGHGVGLCQVGALARARQGDRAAEILRFYYPGAIIVRARAR